MAIRSTNANRASKAYNPAAKPQGGVSAGDRADFGQGPPGRMTKQERWDNRVEEWGLSPWYDRQGNQMPWSGPPGQERGQRTPMFTPNAGDPRNAGYWKNQSTPEEIAADNAAAKQRFSDEKSALMQDPRYSSAWDAYQQVKGSGGRDEANAMKAVLAAQAAAKQAAQKQRYMNDFGMSEYTYDNRFNINWPVPGVAPSPGGGRTMPPPSAPPPGGRTMPQAVPPMQNPMMEGYNPGQSKSGMGQNPMSGPAMSTGNPMGGMEMGGMDPLAAYFSRMQGGYNPMMGGGGMGGMGFGGFGGFNPYSMLGGGMGMGYNPGAQFSPYMMMGGY